ncbi:MAG: tyrosine--tRNA ligase, partial [Bacilli bacterium]|nr:tyrosine--tRNA ligase [Bacilli bacterium]
TYTEFSYMIMQALDFEYLYRNKGCLMQAAGQDQWGNITAGVELIRKKHGVEAYAFTMPLITDKDGKKFGKSEGNALWLDKNKTSSYEMYQFLVNVDDEMIISYLKTLTFLTKEQIEEISKEHDTHPESRVAHKALAREIITFLHGEDEYNKALAISEALFNGNVKDIPVSELETAFKNVPHFEFSDSNIVDLLVDSNIVSSKREAREFITSGTISINGDKIIDLELRIGKEHLLSDKYIVIRRGKKKYYLGIYKN